MEVLAWTVYTAKLAMTVFGVILVMMGCTVDVAKIHSTVVLDSTFATVDQERITPLAAAKYGGQFHKAQIGCVSGFNPGTHLQTSDKWKW